MAHGRYDLTEFEWKTIQPLLPTRSPHLKPWTIKGPDS